jgi:hypothetical protein
MPLLLLLLLLFCNTHVVCIQQVLKSKDYPYLSVLDLPFRAFHIVIGSHEQRNLSEEEVDWYNQVGVS